MLRTFTKALITTVLLTTTVIKADGVNELCSIPTTSLVAAQAQDTDCSFALAELNKFAIATWYNDRETPSVCTSKLQQIVSTCPESSRMTIVIYGLPNKDCEGGYSTDGFNKNEDDYKRFIQQLATAIGQRKVLYVLEPDAVGLLTGNGCGHQQNYAQNIKTALSLLSENPNADIYLDVGYWTLNNPTDSSAVAAVVRDLAKGGRVKGISLNTSNYRSNQEISTLCSNFQSAYGDSNLHCIADTSRNYHPPSSNEWCNANFGAIGKPPTSQTGFSNLDYFIWIKPPGESDGTCDGADRTSDAMKGPRAGDFFKEQFMKLWNNGYFVLEKGLPKIEEGKSPTPVTSSPTPGVTTAPDVPIQTTAPSTQPPTSITPSTNETSPIPTTSAPVPAASTSTGLTSPTASQQPESSPTGLSTYPPTTTPTTKPKKRCRSDLDTSTSSPSTNVVYATQDGVTAAPVSEPVYSLSIEDKSVGFKAKHTDHSSEGNSDGFLHIAAVGCAMAIAIAGVAMRRVYTRKRLERLNTPAKHFGVWQPTPSSVAII